MGRCLAPCDGSVDSGTYAVVVRQLRDTLLRSPDDVVEVITERMERLAKDERFEEAALHRDRLPTFLRAAARTQRLSALTHCAEVVAARRGARRRWRVHGIRHRRRACPDVIPAGLGALPLVAPAAATVTSGK